MSSAFGGIFDIIADFLVGRRESEIEVIRRATERAQADQQRALGEPSRSLEAPAASLSQTPTDQQAHLNTM